MDAQKLLVISDSHGHVSALEAVLKRVQSDYAIDAAAFLGDGIHDLHRAVRTTGFSCAWTTVRGNNDFEFSTPEAACLDWCGHRFFVCHGHRYALYNGYDTLIAAARRVEADAALFGHTHVPSFDCVRSVHTGGMYAETNTLPQQPSPKGLADNVQGLLLINPGSISRPRSRMGASFAIVTCSPDAPLDVQFWGIGSRGEIKEIKVS